MFWRVFQKYPFILNYYDEITYSLLQKIYAIVEMLNDSEKAEIEFELQQIELKNKNIGK